MVAKKGKASGGKKASGKKQAKGCLLILCGFPGSGKSTLSSALVRHGAVRVSQDELGCRKLCEKVMEKALKAGSVAILDRTNLSKSDRAMWIRPARALGVTRIDCIHLAIEKEVCIERALNRPDHPTLPPELAAGVVEKLSLQPPHVREGFENIHCVSFETIAEANGFARTLMAELTALH